MLLPITLTFAAACALINLWLAGRCVRFRIKDKVLHGDGGHGPLARRMRAHANFAENTPIVLILFALVELAGGPASWLWIVALVYVVARLAHAVGMDADNPTVWRAAGTMATFGTMVVLAIAALVLAYDQSRAMPVPTALSGQA